MHQLATDVGLGEKFLENVRHGLQAGIVRIGKVHATIGFEAKRAAARAKDAKHFVDDLVGIGHVEKKVAGENEIERGVGKREFGCVALFEADARIFRAAARVGDEVLVVFEAGDFGVGKVGGEKALVLPWPRPRSRTL
jgi:hypothetical protein